MFPWRQRYLLNLDTIEADCYGGTSSGILSIASDAATHLVMGLRRLRTSALPSGTGRFGPKTGARVNRGVLGPKSRRMFWKASISKASDMRLVCWLKGV
jgi:hypothetical protein